MPEQAGRLPAYAEELKERRIEAGMSQRQLAKEVFVHHTLVARWESGTRKPGEREAVRLDLVLNTGGTFQRFLDRNPFAPHFDRAAEAEGEAVRIEEYAAVLVPGLLQTEAYARAVFLGAEFSTSPDVVDKRVVSRLKRASILDNELPECWFILSETVLRVLVGSAGVMAEQLTHITDLVRRNRVRVQVVPFSQGNHGAMSGSVLSLMKFSDAPDLAYVEALHTGNVMDDDQPELVQHCRDAYDLARAAALSPGLSLHLLDTVTKEYRSYEHGVLPDQRGLAQVQLQRG
ncbi:helix-turn-helix transcriptional regulator [Streptomyces chumphonensis]|uniref:Helix-turn-helix transcriptional regulator n=1 Tax=Streptomyces chumphonensis TaxID=1214925 RepID=A0A927EZB4_9ACTN|nr:helix-turn-helix transcriptional regulator [Streptomyces chumphonensis]MBD3932228.1 helix-turn-helix transcriptional regulator [Streptomyces chumphonensis]